MKKLNFINKALILIGILFVIAVKTGNTQSFKDLRINEILVINDSSITDEYNQHGAWIEIYNGGGKTQNMSGFYFSDDPNNPKKYKIPEKTKYTYVAPYSYLVFWIDNQPEKGTRHLAFNLKREGGFLGLYDTDGEKIDELNYNTPVPDASVARAHDGGKTLELAKHPTPGFTNNHEANQSKAKQFVKYDPIGIGMTMISMTVVFFALIFLYLVFRNISRFYEAKLRKKALLAQGKVEEANKVNMDEEITGEELAAAFMALHMHLSSLEDAENTVITLKKVSRTYSPWSSKIYGMRKHPRN